MLRAAVALVALTACGGGDGGGDPAPACGETAALATPQFESVVGSIQILDEWALYDGTSGPERARGVSGRGLVVDRAMPDFNTLTVFGGFQTETLRSGDCRLLEHVPAVCDPTCVQSVCVAGACVPYLEPRDAGPIDVTGLDAPATMSFDEFRGYWMLAPEPAPPGAAECAAITVSAPGADAPGFTASAVAVGALDPSTIDLAIDLEDDADARITWAAWGADARVRLRLVSPNRGHGTPVAAIVECDVADTGALTVPRDLIARLPPSHDAYCAGYDCPSSSITRYQRALVDGDGGRLEFIAGSALEFRIRHNPELAP